MEVGQTLPLPVAVFAANSVPFTQCQHLPLATQISNGRFFDSPPAHSANSPAGSEERHCTWLDMRAKAAGFTAVKVSYRYLKKLEIRIIPN